MSVSSRWIAILVTGLAAALALSTAGNDASASMTMPNTTKVIAIHEAMDKLWTDHVTWTRIVIADFDSNAADLKPDLARLLRNQVDIGNAIKPYYGTAAGNELTTSATATRLRFAFSAVLTSIRWLSVLCRTSLSGT
jgi:hypothetical protein